MGNNSSNNVDFHFPTLMASHSNESLSQRADYAVLNKSKKLSRHSTGEDVLSKYSNSNTVENGSIPVNSLIDKVCIVTGGNSGLGFETIRVLLLGDLLLLTNPLNH